jgi:hypothetical protein
MPPKMANFAIFCHFWWQPAKMAAGIGGCHHFFCVGNLQWRLPFLLAAFFGGVPKMEACQLWKKH